MLTSIGLSLIVIAWIFQLFTSLKKKKKLSLNFIIIYSIGVLFLVVDGLGQTLNTITIINLLSLLASLAVMVVVIKK
jgi:hypothetical protein